MGYMQEREQARAHKPGDVVVGQIGEMTSGIGKNQKGYKFVPVTLEDGSVIRLFPDSWALLDYHAVGLGDLVELVAVGTNPRGYVDWSVGGPASDPPAGSAIA